jgi:hypothetical protein
MQPSNSRPQAAVAQRPRMVMVFAAAFVAGGAAAVGVNSVLDVWRTQAKPIVESEPIFVALRSLPQGAPVTVWDVGLRSWPKAMLPATAIRAADSFEGCVLRHPLREGQPLLSMQLMRQDGLAAPGSEPDPFDGAASATTNAFAATVPATPEADLWAPAATMPEPRPALLKPTSTDVAPLVPNAREPAGPTNTTVSPDQTAGEPIPTPAPSVAGPDVVAPGVGPLPEAAEPAVGPAVDPVAGSPTPAVAQPLPESAPRTAPGGANRVPDEPTPAETAAPTPAPQAEPPLVSVMKQPADQDPVTPADVTPPTGGQPQPKEADRMVRYLVVPERIAREADTLFAATVPPAQQPVVQPPSAPTVAPVAEGIDGVTTVPLTPLPEAEDAVAETPPPPRQSVPQPAAPVARPTAPRTAGPTAPSMRQTTTGEQPLAGRPKATPRQSQAPARQPAPPARRGSIDTPRPRSDSPSLPEKPRRFGAVMSSITSGFEAMVGGAGRKQPPRPSDYDEAVATDDPQLLPAPLPR